MFPRAIGLRGATAKGALLKDASKALSTLARPGLAASACSLFNSGSNVLPHFAALPSPLSTLPLSRGMATAAADSGSAAAAEEEAAKIQTDRPIRNYAIIAHVDHGKTSLTDKLIRYCDPTFTGSMDSNAQEVERGITILSKWTSFSYNGLTINLIDTPGHSDFSGEVQRILSMVDGVLLVVDALEGPMPQTRYVLSKALARGLRPIVVLNKCDREGCRPHDVQNEVLDLFVALDASDEQLDFPIVYCSAREGWTGPKPDKDKQDMGYLLKVISEHVPPPKVLGDEQAPFKMLVSQMVRKPGGRGRGAVFLIEQG